MSQSQITYNGKTITFAGPPTAQGPRAPSDWLIDPFLPRTINATLTGIVETIYHPRIDVRVSTTWAQIIDAALRVQLDNFWQWIQQGNSFRFVLDTAHAVKTTISNQEAVGSTSIQVASASGITAPRQYVIVGGPNYQVVNVTNVSGTDITISPGLDFVFAAGSTFRDRYLWDAKLRNADSPCPIHDINLSEGRFDFSLAFIEIP